jgi:hypothetical protein
MIPADQILSLSKNSGQREQMSEKNVPIIDISSDEVQALILQAATTGKSRGFCFINGGILPDDIIGELKVADYKVYLSKIDKSYSTCIEWKNNSAKKYLNYGEYTEL